MADPKDFAWQTPDEEWRFEHPEEGDPTLRLVLRQGCPGDIVLLGDEMFAHGGRNADETGKGDLVIMNAEEARWLHERLGQLIAAGRL